MCEHEQMETADEYVSAAEAALVSFVSTRIARLEREEL